MKLLLAEDEAELSKALCTILKHNNYSVDAVYNGTDALDYIMNEDYDGIIMDIMMPGMDGISVLKAMRQKGKNTPVILLTAKSEIDDKVVLLAGSFGKGNSATLIEVNYCCNLVKRY